MAERYKSARRDPIGKPLNQGTDVLSAGGPFTCTQLATLMFSKPLKKGARQIDVRSV